MNAVLTHNTDRTVARAALGRAVLIGRAAATLTAVGAGLRLVDDPSRLLIVAGIVLVTTGAGCVVLAHWPGVVRWPLSIIALDTLIVLGILAVSRGGVGYFCYAAGASALAGVLLGMRAMALCIAHATLGYLVAATVLRAASPPMDIAIFVLAFPISDVLAGIAAATAATALVRYVDLSVEVVASAQRSAAASERARLARELHDSVSKTLRGVSFAALALPSSLRRHPAMAEQLASTVSEGAATAAREARELLEGLRLDTPDQDFSETVNQICREWEQSSQVHVQLVVAPVDPPLTVRYELARILHEALHNVTKHANARHVDVSLARLHDELLLSVRDDGDGFRLPEDPATLRAGGYFGIIGIYERAKSVHGMAQLTSAPGWGTRLEVWAPLGEEPPTTTRPPARGTTGVR